MHRIVCNVITGEITQVDLTAEEIAEIEAHAATEVLPTPPAPTKEQLMAELAALTSKINALE
jgi:hypothetical protein